MKTNLQHSLFEPVTILALNKSTLIAWAAISLLFVETFSGVLRFYFDQFDIAALLYLPKMACIVLIALELITFRTSRWVWLTLLLLALSGLLAMLNGASVQNVGFALFMNSPLLFGLVCAEHLNHRKPLLFWCMVLLLAACVLGVALDKMIELPWKGYSYTLEGVNMQSSLAWAAGDVDRPAGFSRMSSTLAVMIGAFTLYIAAFTRSKVVLIVLLGIAFGAILASTNKSTAAAFVLTLGLWTLSRYRMTCQIIFTIVVLMTLALPVLGLMINFDPLQASGSSDGLLASAYDRLVNTWPYAATVVDRQGWSWLGAGFGMVGTGVSMFPVANVSTLMVTDNTAVYLWATLGVAGLFLYCLLIPLLIGLRNGPLRIDRALLGTTFLIVLVSWTTDVVESPVAGLFIGMAIGHALQLRAMLGTSPVNPRRPLPHWPSTGQDA